MGGPGVLYVFVGAAVLFLPACVLALAALPFAPFVWCGYKVSVSAAESRIAQFAKSRLDKVQANALASHVVDLSNRIEATKTDPRQYFLRAMAFVVQQDWAAALKDFLTCLTYAPEQDCRLYYYIANVYTALGKPKDAEEYLSLAMDTIDHYKAAFVDFPAGVDVPQFNPDSIRNERAMNLYRLAWHPDVSINREQRDKYLRDALALKKSVRPMVAVNHDFYHELAVMRYFSAFNSNTVRDYYTDSWTVGKQLMLAVNDPKSPLSVFKGHEYLRFFILRDFSNPNFPGFSVFDYNAISRVVTEANKAIQYLVQIDSHPYFAVAVSSQVFLKPENANPKNIFRSKFLHDVRLCRKIMPPHLQELCDNVPCKVEIVSKRPRDSESEWDVWPTGSFKSQQPILGMPVVHDMLKLHCDALSSSNPGTMIFDKPSQMYELHFDILKGSIQFELKREVRSADPLKWKGTATLLRYLPEHEAISPKPRIGSGYDVEVKITPQIKRSVIHDFYLSLTQPIEMATKPENVMGGPISETHVWSKVRLMYPRHCQHCGHTIKSWGYADHSQCTLCDMLVHTRCEGAVINSCYHKKLT